MTLELITQSNLGYGEAGSTMIDQRPLSGVQNSGSISPNIHYGYKLRISKARVDDTHGDLIAAHN